LANRLGLSAIPLYLLAGLSKDFVHGGAEIGILRLLFMLGLEYTGEELSAAQHLQVSAPSAHC
jgi:K+:H+ antiporter subunit KhtU